MFGAQHFLWNGLINYVYFTDPGIRSEGRSKRQGLGQPPRHPRHIWDRRVSELFILPAHTVTVPSIQMRGTYFACEKSGKGDVGSPVGVVTRGETRRSVLM